MLCFSFFLLLLPVKRGSLVSSIWRVDVTHLRPEHRSGSDPHDRKSLTETHAWLGPPVVPFSLPFFGWEGSHAKNYSTQSSWHPYSNLSAGGPCYGWSQRKPKASIFKVPIWLVNSPFFNGYFWKVAVSPIIRSSRIGATSGSPCSSGSAPSFASPLEARADFFCQEEIVQGSGDPQETKKEDMAAAEKRGP